MDLVNQLDKLKAFKVIAESGTMREAAKRLHVTQPSLTKLVKKLEGAVGIELLSRGRHGVIPTDAGRQLQGFATLTLKALEDLEQKLLNPLDHMAGHLRVGAYASLSEYLWPNFIPAFRKKSPNLRISIYTGDGIAHRGALVQGEIDILVEAEPLLSNDLISWNLYEDRFNFYTHPAGETTWTPDLIESLPLIYSPNAFDRNHKKIIQYLEENGYQFRERLEMDSFMAVLAFAKKGLGLAVLPNRLAEAALQTGQLHLATLKGFSAKGFGNHNFTATIQESRKDDPRLRSLIGALQEWFKRELTHTPDRQDAQKSPPGYTPSRAKVRKGG